MKKKNLVISSLIAAGGLIFGGYLFFKKKKSTKTENVEPIKKEEESEQPKEEKKSPKIEIKEKIVNSKKEEEYEDVEDLTVSIIKLLLKKKDDTKILSRTQFCDVVLRSIAASVPDYSWLESAPRNLDDLEGIIKKYGLWENYENYLLVI